ncbi:LytTR family DNA-binding domain-containing protein [Mangrovivirga sp. M17]|uniref:LytTR family DNA-binding domain-containing protein n=1 Tax=Mangrovivirga halotolerans TaxID=2993936 RepID=A0ABT3RXM4_9BACT|nr:LytTR family DNA-binding domain-containing protein [Mangrovivirga halotolerans]MCX2746113.1 LytTR family DNA-binding domain-containing protein [Mangrovivirga halotolerans]
MNYLIIEDEEIAAEKLKAQLKKIDNQAEFSGYCQSVSETIELLKSDHKPVDLVFMDIQLTDGISFEIFKNTHLDYPVIFVTAYDEYALEAFKVNSVHYLLKPVSDSDLQQAIDKFNSLNDLHGFQSLLSLESKLLNRNKFKDRFISQIGTKFFIIKTEEISGFYADGKTVYCIKNNDNTKYIIEYSLDHLENELLDPNKFFRINRKMIIHIDKISEIRNYVNSRLLLMLPELKLPFEAIVSRERVASFKSWLNQ